MLAVLQFIFSSFWHWLGTLILLMVVTGAVSRFAYNCCAALMARRNG